MSDYTKYPKVKPDGTLPQKVLDRLDERYVNHDEHLPGSGNGTALNAQKFGAIGDGVADDSVALQRALDAAAGKALFIPAGRYKVTATFLSVSRGTEVFGEHGTVMVASGTVENIFRAAGSYLGSRQTELAVAVDAGADTLTVKTAHNYVQGDILRLVSQRVSTSDDAGEDRLGWSTGTAQGPFFSEMVTVQDVVSPTQIRLDRGLIFSGYRPDKTQETDPNATASATLRQSNGSGDNVVIRDIAFEGPCKSFIRLIQCRDSLVSNVKATLPDTGRAVEIEDSYRCEVRSSSAVCEKMLYDAADHALQNVFHIAGSQSCGFVGCRTVWGAQAYDITYRSTALFPSVFCYVKDSASFGALFNPMTIHPGTYGCEVVGNNFSECRLSGLSIRGNASIVENNRIVGSRTASSSGEPHSGIYLLEGSGKGSVIAGNHIEGFKGGFRVNDSGGKPFRGWNGALFANNVVKDFDIGFYRIVSYGEPVSLSPQGITIRGNVFESRRANAVGVITCDSGRGINSLDVSANSFRLPGDGTQGVRVTANSIDTIVKDNVFHEIGQALVWDPTGLTDESPASVVHWSGNTCIKVGIDRTPPPSEKFQISSPDGTMHILPADSYSLNSVQWSSRMRPASVSAATISRGWPVEGFDGYVESTRMSSSALMQTGYHMDGRVSRRSKNIAGWSNWRVI